MRTARLVPHAFGLAVILAVTGVACVNPSNICPLKPITQGVFGEITSSSGALETKVEVDVYTTLDGAKDMMVGSTEATRGGYQFNLLPSKYVLCAKTVCTSLVTVPTGIVELSAVDAAAGLTWDTPVAVPPEQMIGPCTYGD